MGIAAKFGKIKGYIKDYGINYAIKKIYYRFEIKYIKEKKKAKLGLRLGRSDHVETKCKSQKAADV